MFSELIRKYMPDLAARGIEVCFSGDGTMKFTAVELRRKGKKIEITKSEADILWEDLLKYGNKNLPLILTFSGKGVLTRSWDTRDQSALNTIIPMGNPGEFYINIHDKSEYRADVCIMRKDQAEEVLSLFTGEGFRVVSFVVGGQDPGDRDKGEMPAPFCSAFWGAAQWLLGNLQAPDAPAHKYEKIYEERRGFKAALGFVLGIIFLLLFLNYALFSHYREKLQTLNQSSSFTNDLSQKAMELEIKVLEKEKLLEELGMRGLSRHSFYADRLAQSLPSGIRLSALEIFPLQKEESEAVFKVNKDEIEIRGYCSESTMLASWMDRLNILPWIKGLELVQFNRADWKSDGSFVLKVKV